MNRLARHLKRCREIRHVEELGRVRCGERKQPRQRVQGMDTGHVTCIALNLCFDEIAVPGSPPGRHPPRQCRRVSPADDAISERESEPIRDSRGEAAAKQCLDEARPLLVELALRERMQPQNAHAAGERVGEMRHQQDVGGARQDEPPGGPPLVDGRLQRREDLGDALDFIEDRSPRQPFHEADRVAFGRVLDGFVVK